MVRKILVLCIVATLAITGLAIAETKVQGVSDSYNLESISQSNANGDMNISLQKIKGEDYLILSNIRVVPIGHNPDHDSWLAETVRIESGIADLKSEGAVIVNRALNPGEAIAIPLLDFGKKFQVPVVEHFYGRGDKGLQRNLPLRLSPHNPWVCYKANSDGSPDLQTLFIGVVSYPNGAKLPLKLALQITGAMAESGTYVPQDAYPALAMTQAQMEEAARRMGISLASN